MVSHEVYETSHTPRRLLLPLSCTRSSRRLPPAVTKFPDPSLTIPLLPLSLADDFRSFDCASRPVFKGRSKLEFVFDLLSPSLDDFKDLFMALTKALSEGISGFDVGAGCSSCFSSFFSSTTGSNDRRKTASLQNVIHNATDR